MLDPYRIREDFPILRRRINGVPIVYFDNTATTHKPRQVIEAIKRFYEEYNANVHRGLHTLSQEASEAFEEAHDTIAEFIGARGREEIILTYNATESLNLAAWTWGLRNLRKGDEIVMSVMEHHSNMLPWRRVAELTGARIRYVGVDDYGRLDYEALEEAMSRRVKVVAMTMMSNVTGAIVDIKKVAKLAHDHGAIVVADGAQAVPHMPVRVYDLGIDFLAFSGHKMMGPTGTGILWGREDILEGLEPFKVGGDTIKDVTLEDVIWHDLPWRFEAGTPNIAGMIGLAEAAKYLMRLGMENVRAHEEELTRYCLKRMDELRGLVETYGPLPEERGGIVPFNVLLPNGERLNHHIVGKALDLFGIAVRTGKHCAHPLHYRLGLDGTVRASFYVYNTKDEIDYFVDALKKIAERAEELASLEAPPAEVCRPE